MRDDRLVAQSIPLLNHNAQSVIGPLCLSVVCGYALGNMWVPDDSLCVPFPVQLLPDVCKCLVPGHDVKLTPFLLERALAFCGSRRSVIVVSRAVVNRVTAKASRVC